MKKVDISDAEGDGALLRAGRKNAVRVGMVLAMIVAFGVVMGISAAVGAAATGGHPSSGWMQLVMVIGIALTFIGSQFQRPLDAKADRLLRLRQEAIHKRRLVSAAFIAVLLVLLSAVEVFEAVSHGGQADTADWSMIGSQLLIWLMTTSAFMGWNMPAAQRRVLDDELIRAHRGQAVHIGFWVLAGGGMSLVALAQGWPQWAMAGLAPLINLSLVSVVAAFVWLEWAPARDD